MNTGKRFFIPALALAALLGIGVTANAQMMGHGTAHGSAGAALSPEKQAAVQKAYADFDAATASLRQQLTAKQYELEAQIVGGAPDDKKVQSLTKDVSDLSAKLFKAQVDLQGQMTKLGLPAGAMGGGMMGCGTGGMGSGSGMHHAL